MNYHKKNKKLLGFAAPYMLGLVVGVGIVSTTMANQAKLKLANYEKTYVQQKLENVQKIAKSLQNVYTVNADGTVTQAKLKEHFYTNAFNFDDIITATQVGSTGDTKTVISVDGNKYTLNNLSTATASNLLQKDLSNSATVVLDENSIRQQQISKSYENMKLQAKDVYNSLIADKSYTFPCTISNRYKDAWGRNFNFTRNALNNATISFNLPWDTSKSRFLNIKLPEIQNTEPVTIKEIHFANNNYFVLDSAGNIYVSGIMAGVGNGFIKTSLENIEKIYNYGGSIYFISKSGELWVSGENSSGELGIGTTSDVDNIIKTPLTNVKEIIYDNISKYSKIFTAALTYSGDLYVTGYNTYGQLGLNHKNNVTTWTLSASNIRDAYIGYPTYMAIIDNNDTLFYSGYNAYYTHGYSGSKIVWTQSNTNVKEVYPSRFQSYIVKNNGEVWETGRLPGYSTSGVPWQLSSTFNGKGIRKYVFYNSNNDNYYFMIDGNGDLWVYGDATGGILGYGGSGDRTTWTKITTANNFLDLWLHGLSTYAFNNNLYVTGSNADSRLGLGATANYYSWTPITNITEQIKEIQFTFHASDTFFVITVNDNLYATGRNGAYEAGLGHNNTIQNWTHVASNVKQFKQKGFISSYTDENKIYVAGNDHFKLFSSSSTYFTNFTEVFDINDYTGATCN